MATIELDHRRAGAGEPLLLIHGIGSTWRVWKPILARLEARHEVLGVDVPGFGRSAPLPEGVTPTASALADALEKALDAAGWERAHVAGNSMGGRLALELARRGRAASAVAISPAGMWGPKERTYSRGALRFQRAVATRLAPFAETLTRTAAGRTVLFSGVASRPWRADPADAAETLRLFAGAPGWEATLKAMMWDQPRALGSIRCPVRIVWGSRDTLLFPRQADRFVREIPGAELVRLKGLGHVPMGDDPQAVADAILDFTARHAQEPAGDAPEAAADGAEDAPAPAADGAEDATVADAAR
jgi:pimeloyl-ACP methyl ester carboxylesterase